MTSSPTTSPEYQRRLQQLRQRFLDGLPARILLLDQLSIELRTVGNDAAALAAIKNECHKLAGVAASFGFPKIGRRAAEIDEALCDGELERGELERSLEDLMNLMEDQLDGKRHDE